MRTETRHIVTTAPDLRDWSQVPDEVDEGAALEWIYCLVDHWALCATVPYKQGYKVLGVYATVDRSFGSDALWEWRAKNMRGIPNGGHSANLADAKRDALRWATNRHQDWAARTDEPTIETMVREWLVCNGYSGLYYSEDGVECGCGLEDLMPCGEAGSSCVAGYAYRCGQCSKAETCGDTLPVSEGEAPPTIFAPASHCEPDYREEAE